MQYPGRLIKAGETDARVVRALKLALNRALAVQRLAELKLDPENPNFGPSMTQAVKLFQARHVDAQGRPLKIDGEVGSITWAVLFGATTVPEAHASTDPFLRSVLAIAAAEEGKGVRETPRNSNRGPEVDAYLKRVGLGGGFAWCCAFTYWCFDEAARAAGRPNPMVRTAGCLAHWNGAERAGARRIPAAQAVADPDRVRPGMVFIMDFGGGAGHTGFVEAVDGGFITTIEGNTDASKTREGGGVYRLTRKIADINKGFIDYGVPPPVRALRGRAPMAQRAVAPMSTPPRGRAAPAAKKVARKAGGKATGKALDEMASRERVVRPDRVAAVKDAGQAARKPAARSARGKR
jgi:hypothetical protein